MSGDVSPTPKVTELGENVIVPGEVVCAPAGSAARTARMHRKKPRRIALCDIVAPFAAGRPRREPRASRVHGPVSSTLAATGDAGTPRSGLFSRWMVRSIRRFAPPAALAPPRRRSHSRLLRPDGRRERSGRGARRRGRHLRLRRRPRARRGGRPLRPEDDRGPSRRDAEARRPAAGGGQRLHPVRVRLRPGARPTSSRRRTSPGPPRFAPAPGSSTRALCATASGGSRYVTPASRQGSATTTFARRRSPPRRKPTSLSSTGPVRPGARRSLSPRRTPT